MTLETSWSRATDGKELGSESSQSEFSKTHFDTVKTELGVNLRGKLIDKHKLLFF